MALVPDVEDADHHLLDHRDFEELRVRERAVHVVVDQLEDLLLVVVAVVFGVLREVDLLHLVVVTALPQNRLLLRVLIRRQVLQQNLPDDRPIACGASA